MEDKSIIELYWKRDERAIEESRAKYGVYCSTIARNILDSNEDAKEVLNSTWLSAWNSIPPKIPQRLSAFLGRLTRNHALDRYRKNTSSKRSNNQVTLCLEELSQCIGESYPIDDKIVLRQLLNRFLRELPSSSQRIFLLRYWYIMPIEKIAVSCGISEGAVKMQLQRMRARLKTILEKEGIGL